MKCKMIKTTEQAGEDCVKYLGVDGTPVTVYRNQ